ncbi:hypothetical protein [Casimicrobium huifangae]|uniref:hypothetical protein n=1 Tax=Casimicrobium huifangae TaxID=2591109 RepID=UPI0037836C20
MTLPKRAPNSPPSMVVFGGKGCEEYKLLAVIAVRSRGLNTDRDWFRSRST